MLYASSPVAVVQRFTPAPATATNLRALADTARRDGPGKRDDSRVQTVLRRGDACASGAVIVGMPQVLACCVSSG